MKYAKALGVVPPLPNRAFSNSSDVVTRLAVIHQSSNPPEYVSRLVNLADWSRRSIDFAVSRNDDVRVILNDDDRGLPSRNRASAQHNDKRLEQHIRVECCKYGAKRYGVD